MRAGGSLALALLTMAAPAFAADHLVRDQSGYAAAVKKAAPGDRIVLADGEWRDFQIVFTGSGTADKPITLTAQTPGKVVIAGKSNLRVGGKHLVALPFLLEFVPGAHRSRHSFSFIRLRRSQVRIVLSGTP